MEIEEFYWGKVQWLDGLHHNINIGISLINPHTYQKPHIHYENEQFIYVISGEGAYQVNDQTFQLKAGDYLLFPYNSIHSTTNNMDEPLVDLVVSIPRLSNNNYINHTKEQSTSISKDLLGEAIESIIIEMKDQVILDYCIINGVKDIKYCSNKPIKYDDLTSIFQLIDSINLSPGQSTTFKQYFLFPIFFHDEVLGIIIFNSESLLIDEMPTSTKKSIFNFFNSLIDSIESYAIHHSVKKKLNDSIHQLENKRNIIKTMAQQLNFEKEKSSSLKINNHFMFNTLNYMANLAIKEDNVRLYDLIVLFADMVRYTSDNSGMLISIRQELEYLNAYIQLQKSRYPNFEFNIEVDDTVLQNGIPINCLQPIVENAFSHGFINYDGRKIINLVIHLINKEKIELIVQNNGNTLDMNGVRNINSNLAIGTDNGLSLVYQKFYNNFQKNFTMSLQSNPEFTQMTIRFPKEVVM
ncbi:sensor histidine kinase [Facklamia sp. P12932]|uniref:sensor histidine kinase n=1 Tax=Facklamia sp. P12932 TaxID=3421947 RepID=UPI003D1684C2